MVTRSWAEILHTEKSMLRNLVTDLFREGRITTTLDRAKEAGREAEKLVTLAKRGDLSRRQVLAYVSTKM